MGSCSRRRPSSSITFTQDTLTAVFAELAGAAFVVSKEFPFRPLPEYEVWTADVAIVERARYIATAKDDYFLGTPLIVIEVLSPSNTASEILDREEICLANGAKEFWLVDPKRQSIKVTYASGVVRHFHADSRIPLEAIPGCVLEVSRIFPKTA